MGLGTAQAAQEAGNIRIIGVDSDWTLTAPEYADVIYGSVLKQIGAAVYAAISEATSPSGFSNESYVGTLENDGVGLAGITGDFTAPDRRHHVGRHRHQVTRTARRRACCVDRGTPFVLDWRNVSSMAQRSGNQA